ncbi:LPS export ABC transporter periplasmic protein LptC [Sulfurovum sp. XGS-02]|uniref:LPS export ABC transporter periplasmic protein LptC n=1 Tax=Sulfurovum sp. XGS-02 TaxID=2925411 RepID=UPI0020537BF8|nr:LPS export ABC transporter periplasmic protein LptC [Sulfurovum sp. XGS-02]UPT76760.1 LPS export ABC transporter periplasmic protein LptC [Sulfurovum sp. XGS-02]
MGIKLEYILTIAIIGIIAGTLMLKLGNAPATTKAFTKELEFTGTTLTEVDTDNMNSRIYGTYGARDKGVLRVENIRYFDDNIESLSADKGKLEGDILQLEGHVVMKEQGGYTYKTEHATYDKKSEILNITKPFTAVRGQNMIKGKSLEYDTRQKKATGQTVDTVFYTPDK